MKIGFTSRVCPEWDLGTIVSKAAELGFNGVELGTLSGQSHLPDAEELTSDPDAVKQMLADKGVELVCLGSAQTLDSFSARELKDAKKRVLEVVDLAATLNCPYVRVPIGNVPAWDNRYRALARIASTFAEFAPEVARRQVTLLVENGGDFAGSDDLWCVLDESSHPAVAACWNPCQGMTVLDRPTLSVPRLGTRIRMVHICDASFDPQGHFAGFRHIGHGEIELERLTELLRGIMFKGYLMFDWPRVVMENLPPADEVLPEVRDFLTALIEKRDPVLSAYKGDKKPVVFDLPESLQTSSSSAK